jgi:hypothetical protein
MRKLIRSKATKTFLTTDGQWTDQVQKAAHFPEQSEARAAVQKFKLFDVEFYYSFSEHATSDYDFALSLQ